MTKMTAQEPFKVGDWVATDRRNTHTPPITDDTMVNRITKLTADVVRVQHDVVSRYGSDPDTPGGALATALECAKQSLEQIIGSEVKT